MAKLKNAAERELLSTANGFRLWETRCGFKTTVDAARKLGVPLRTYFRWKQYGLPNGTGSAAIMRESILDRMEAALPRKRG